jgi:hypothetical protein
LENRLDNVGDTRPVRSHERRDARRAIEHWSRHTSGEGPVPLVTAFDFSSIRSDWAHRFLICTDRNVENAAFLAYGSQFAAQLGLPETVTAIAPLRPQLPDRYQVLFAEGCTKAISKQLPARFNGSFEHDFTPELYRAVFLPIRLHPNWSKWLIFGSFNCREVLSVDKQARNDVAPLSSSDASSGFAQNKATYPSDAPATTPVRGSPVHVVEIHREGDVLAGPMAEIRDWLDAHHITPKLFRMSIPGSGVVFRLEFHTEVEARAFAAAFGVRVTGFIRF